MSSVVGPPEKSKASLTCWFFWRIVFCGQIWFLPKGVSIMTTINEVTTTDIQTNTTICGGCGKTIIRWSNGNGWSKNTCCTGWHQEDQWQHIGSIQLHFFEGVPFRADVFRTNGAELRTYWKNIELSIWDGELHTTNWRGWKFCPLELAEHLRSIGVHVDPLLVENSAYMGSTDPIWVKSVGTSPRSFDRGFSFRPIVY